ncbi:uncharacterized protein TRAVEDRAFT_20154 [Trametes versicolor FP-101664 SS1]|uniref:uncharacterized protein n=1 Tax=Trametes versicolor (strain FP-101664) TaxID=717944 RepID=UPI0004623A58|nr:uncharacterized protein TRAVEDRAFT_20154 [Trametes versicolor FP-101664 SS1]EIW59885.1 hypothetical protein TRAVEDRAFT_20154 [Trametes versicolor FP-101664 SS1]
MTLAPRTDTAKSIYPIPKPNKLADRIHHCAKSSSTLQRQMRFESDPRTFSALTKLIRKTAASYTDLTLPYKWQDPQTLDDIRDDVLQQCPTLEEMYVDAWPVYSYLQLAMKQHALGYGYKMVPGLSTSTASTKSSDVRRNFPDHPVSESSKRVTTEPEQTPSTSTAAAPSSNSPARRSLGMELSWAGSTSDKTTVPTKTPNISRGIEAGEEEGEDEEEADELVDELYDISSSGSEKLADPTYEDPGNVSEESSTSEEGPLSQWPKSTGFPAFNFARDILCLSDQRVRDSEDDAYSAIGSVYYTPYQGRTPSADGPFDKATTPTTGRTMVTPPSISQPSPVPEPSPGVVRSSIPPHASTSQSAVGVIENMLLARGLPSADAQRITLLFEALGITDETYLRVFARLDTSRKAWISAMREKGEMSEIQAWVVVDMLDAVIRD